MQRILTTERLVLREFVEDDHSFLIQLLNSEGWLQNIGNRNVANKQQAVNYINNSLRSSYEKNGYGLYLVQLKQQNTAVGMCGFVKRDVLPYPDLGFAFLPEHTGAGYGIESATAVLHFGFSQLSFDRVGAITIPSNERSVRLLKKLNFQWEDEISINNEQLMLFGITAGS